MSLFQCDKCGCLENTACGWSHPRFNKRLTKPENLGKELCAVCAPTEYPNGDKTAFKNVWHDRFLRRFFEKGMYITNGEGNLIHRSTGVIARLGNGSETEIDA